MAGSTPDYDFFGPDGARSSAAGSRTGAGRPLDRHGKGLSGLADGDAAPHLPAGRLSAPPLSPPPVFERPAPPRPDVRPWSVPAQVGPAAAPDAAPDAGSEAWYRRPTATTVAAAPPAVPTVSSAAGPAPRPGGRPVPAFTAHADNRPAPAGAAARTPWPVPAPRRADVTVGRPSGRRSRRVAVAAGLAVVLVAAGTAAAFVGVPRWVQRTDRTVWERTTVRIPRTVAGLPRITTASATAQARSSQGHLLGTGTGQMISDLAVYGRARGTRVAVVVARPQHPLTAEERDVVRTGFTQGVAAEGVVLTERDAGPLGGWFGCGVKAGRTTTCLAVDAGAVVSVTVTATGGSAVTVAREVRAAVERRA